MVRRIRPSAEDPVLIPPERLVRPATVDDIAAITAIYNDAVLHTTAIWNETVVDVDDRLRWHADRTAAGFPVLVAEVAGAVAGYAAYGPFRPFEGFRHTGELSIYVDRDRRGEGIGNTLLAALVDEAKRRKLHVLVAGIEAGNTASLNLHKSNGFVETGHLREVGMKFGRWLDLVFMQRIL